MREADSHAYCPAPNPEWLLSAITRAAADVAQEVDLDGTIERIVAGARTYLGFDRADLLLYERDQGQITRRAGVDGTGKVVFHGGAPQPIGNARAAVQEVVLGRIPYSYQFHQDVVVPLAAHREILGALVVDNAISGAPIPESVVSPLCLFGRFSAAALSGALQRRRLQRIRFKLERLTQSCRTMAGFQDTEALFHTLLPAMREMLDANRYAVWHRPPGRSWRCLAHAGLSESYLDRIQQLHLSLEENDLRAARLFRAGQVLVVQADIASPEEALLLAEDTEALLGLPVVQGGELVGTLFFLYDDAARISGEAVHLADLFAGFAAAVTVTAGLTQHELFQAESHKKQFYRDIVYAVTNGKLNLCEPSEIEERWPGSMAEQAVETEGDIKAVRDLIQQIGQRAGMTGGRIEDLCLCASEAATNALKHAGSGRVWLDYDETLVRVRVMDAGTGIDPLQLPRATLMRGYSTRASMGLGFTLMHELADRIYLHTGPQGTTLILEMSIRPVSEAERMLALLTLGD